MADLSTWCGECSAQVLRVLRQEIDRRAVNARQRELMQAAVAFGRCQRVPGFPNGEVHLPILCHAAISDDFDAPIAIATATLSLWTGIELFDNLTDGDLDSWFRDQPEQETVLASLALCSALPSGLIADLNVPAAVRCTMHRVISEQMLRASAGQHEDLRHRGDPMVSRKAVEQSVLGKNGAPKAMFASLGALSAGASSEVVDAYRRYGEAYGVLAQYTSDFSELFEAEARDLMQGNRTLQIAICLEMLPEDEARDFLGLLEDARTQNDARERARSILRQARFIWPWKNAVHAAAEDALAALDAAKPSEPAGAVLRHLIHVRTPGC